MRKLFFDIETIPLEKERHSVLQELHEKMKQDGKDPGDFETMLTQTSFDGGFGRIACIAYAINDEPIKTLSGNEPQMLKDFWKIAEDVDLFVGFNLFSFDLRFIYQRSIVHKIQPTKDLSFARYRHDQIYDLMCEWNKWDFQAKVSLDRLAGALDIPSSKDGEIKGKDVAKAFEDGRISEICEYCERDVEVTRKIYKRMTFEEIPQEEIPF